MSDERRGTPPEKRSLPLPDYLTAAANRQCDTCLRLVYVGGVAGDESCAFPCRMRQPNGRLCRGSVRPR